MLSQRSGVAALLAVFLAALIYFARFTSRDSYPAYSSLRSDESGTRLLYLGLEGTGKLTVARNYLPLPLVQAHNAALLLIGVRPATLLTWSSDELSNLERLARSGNRVTIGITNDRFEWKQFDTRKSAIVQRWGVSLEPKSSPLELLPGNGWVAESDQLLSKPFGAGVILLLSETSLLTNRELAAGGIPPFVPFLIGSSRAVLMDETHLGVEETGSIAGLARHYHLQGLFVGLLLLAALFVWNRAAQTPLPPPADESSAHHTNRDVLVSLLERNLTSSNLIPACVAEWSRTNPGQSIHYDTSIPHSDPVADYRELQDQLKSVKRIHT